MDFGLAKKHLDDHGNPVTQRRKADFRGTVSFASLNAHNNVDLSRRDDIWSLYFVILDFLNERLKLREQREFTMEEVKQIKTQCLEKPEELLWVQTKNIPEVRAIFKHVKSLEYKDRPNYQFIRDQLKSILSKQLEVECQITQKLNSDAVAAVVQGNQRDLVSPGFINTTNNLIAGAQNLLAQNHDKFHTPDP